MEPLWCCFCSCRKWSWLGIYYCWNTIIHVYSADSTELSYYSVHMKLKWRRDAISTNSFFTVIHTFLPCFLQATIVLAVTITGPTNMTAQEGTNVIIDCSVMGAKTQPLLRWRLSGIEYTPSTLPDRYFPTSAGLLIYSVSPNDDGVTVQCFIVLYDPSVSPSYIVINSPIGVVHVVSGDHTTPVSSYNHLLDFTPTLVPIPNQSIIATISPSSSSPSIGYSFPIGPLVVLLVAASFTLSIISVVPLCVAIYIMKRRRGEK